MLMMQESNTGIRSVLESAEATGTYQDFLDSITKFKAVTKEDVQRVAKEYIVKDRANVLVTTQAAPAAGGRRANPSTPSREAN